jgi:hypothetical protein
MTDCAPSVRESNESVAFIVTTRRLGGSAVMNPAFNMLNEIANLAERIVRPVVVSVTIEKPRD